MLLFLLHFVIMLLVCTTRVLATWLRVLRGVGDVGEFRGTEKWSPREFCVAEIERKGVQFAQTEVPLQSE